MLPLCLRTKRRKLGSPEALDYNPVSRADRRVAEEHMSFVRKAHGLLAITFFGVALSTMSSCIEAEGMLYVKNALAEEAVDSGAADACGEVQSSTIFFNIGTVYDTTGAPYVDLSLGSSSALLCVINKLKSRVDNGVETSNVLIYEYDISLDGGAAATHPISTFVSAAGADSNPQESGGQSTTRIQLASSGELLDIGGGLGQGEAAESVAGIKLYGRTTGGIELETNEFFIPLRVYRLDFLCTCDGDPAAGEFPCSDQDPGC